MGESGFIHSKRTTAHPGLMFLGWRGDGYSVGIWDKRWDALGRSEKQRMRSTVTTIETVEYHWVLERSLGNQNGGYHSPSSAFFFPTISGDETMRRGCPKLLGLIVHRYTAETRVQPGTEPHHIPQKVFLFYIYNNYSLKHLRRLQLC